MRGSLLHFRASSGTVKTERDKEQQEKLDLIFPGSSRMQETKIYSSIGNKSMTNAKKRFFMLTSMLTYELLPCRSRCIIHLNTMIIMAFSSFSYYLFTFLFFFLLMVAL